MATLTCTPVADVGIRFEALGVGPAASLIGGVGFLLAPIPFLFHRYGRSIRERSKFAPTQSNKKSNEHDDKDAQPPRSSSRGAANVSEDEQEVEADPDVPDEDPEKVTSDDSNASARDRTDGDPYLDADGIEKAERR